MRVKIDVTVNGFGITSGEILSTPNFSEGYLMSLVLNGLAHVIQDDEVMQSEVDDYQTKAYPNNFLVIKDNALYRATVGEGNFTSATWVANEWTLKIQGA